MTDRSLVGLAAAALSLASFDAPPYRQPPQKPKPPRDNSKAKAQRKARKINRRKRK